MRIIRIIAVLLIGVLLILGACAKMAPTEPAPTTPTPTPEPVPAQGYVEVLISSREYKPSVITVSVGATVTWISKDGEHHTVTSNTGVFDGTIEPFGSFSHTFTEHGTFEYSCAVWPMSGAVIVK
ncbi:MAG: cupredoxin domain-containing protein [Dehalococcoidales bacterium]|nr:cupredoxin domain-containing protein [Dehalococcoidales bacterium]